MFALCIQVIFYTDGFRARIVRRVKADLAVILESEVESKARDSLSLGTGRDLQALNDSRVALVFQARVLSFSVFANNGEVDIGVTSRDTREGFAKNHGGVYIKLLTHSDVPRQVAFDWSEKNSLETNAVALEGLHGLLEKRFPFAGHA